MINWRVRAKNKNFWLAIIPAVILLIQSVAGVFGLQLDLNTVASRLIDVVNTLFVVLAIIGVVNDPTTDGISDSSRALEYREPNKE